MKIFNQNIKLQSITSKINEAIDSAKNEVADKYELIQDGIKKNISDVTSSSANLFAEIGHQSKQIGSNISNMAKAQIVEQFVKAVNLNKMITAISALNIIDPKAKTTLNIISNVLITLKDNPDDKGVDTAIKLLKTIHIKDAIIVLQPVIGLIPYGNHLITLLNLFMK